MGKGVKNGNGFVLKSNVTLKINFYEYQICWQGHYVKETIEFKNDIIFFVMEGKNLWLYNKEYLKPKCGLLLKQSFLKNLIVLTCVMNQSKA
jgi:hypothetical protein